MLSMAAQKRTGVKERIQVTCVACGAAIGRHEPFMAVSRQGSRRGTLATESRPPSTGEAIYHPGCSVLLVPPSDR